MIKIAYRYDVDSVSLLALRMLFSLPFFLLIIWKTRSRGNPEKALRFRNLLEISAYGVLGYYFASLYDFMGLQYITAALERLVLFLYPTIVLLGSSLLFRKPVLRTHLIALAFTYGGIALAFMDGSVIRQGDQVWLGGSLIFLSALTYAVYMIGASILLPKYGSMRYTAIAVSAGGVAILVQHALEYHLDLWHFAAPVYWLSLLMALFSTVLPVFLVSEGIRRIGPANAAIIASIGPVSTIFLGYWFLDEKVGGVQLGGTLLVTIGVAYISLVRTTDKERTS